MANALENFGTNSESGSSRAFTLQKEDPSSYSNATTRNMSNVPMNCTNLFLHLFLTPLSLYGRSDTERSAYIGFCERGYLTNSRNHHTDGASALSTIQRSYYVHQKIQCNPIYRQRSGKESGRTYTRLTISDSERCTRIEIINYTSLIICPSVYVYF